MNGKGKRIREDLDSSCEDGFNKSKKTLRSPQQRQITKKNNTNTEQIDMDEIKIQLAELKAQMEKNTVDIINQLKNEFRVKEEKWENEKKEFMQRIEKLEDNAEMSERNWKKNNIIIKGIKLNNEKEIKKDIESFLKNETKVEAKLNNAYRVKTDKTEFVVARFEDFEDKIKVMKNRKMLRNTDKYIDNDYTKKEQEIQREIRNIGKEHKEKGKKVYVGYQKIFIDDEEYRWDNKEKGVTFYKTVEPKKKN